MGKSFEICLRYVITWRPRPKHLTPMGYGRPSRTGHPEDGYFNPYEWSDDHPPHGIPQECRSQQVITIGGISTTDARYFPQNYSIYIYIHIIYIHIQKLIYNIKQTRNHSGNQSKFHYFVINPQLVLNYPGCPSRAKAPLREQLCEGWLITDTTTRHVDENRLSRVKKPTNWGVKHQTSGAGTKKYD